jgi:hypothetical protein
VCRWGAGSTSEFKAGLLFNRRGVQGNGGGAKGVEAEGAKVGGGEAKRKEGLDKGRWSNEDDWNEERDAEEEDADEIT